jgi:hypothetical protein
MTMLATFFLAHWFFFFFVGKPWYLAAIWGNVFCILVLAPLGWIWSKTKFFPLRPLNESVRLLHKKVDQSIAHHEAHAQQLQEHGEKLEHLISRIEELHNKMDQSNG